jgi:hypothetical protein
VLFEAVGQETWGILQRETLEGTSEAEETADEKRPTSPQKVSKPPVEDAKADLTRKTGDRSLYGFYFKSMGWKSSLFVVLLGIFGVGLSKMPRKFGYRLVSVRIWTV